MASAKRLLPKWRCTDENNKIENPCSNEKAVVRLHESRFCHLSKTIQVWNFKLWHDFFRVLIAVCNFSEFPIAKFPLFWRLLRKPSAYLTDRSPTVRVIGRTGRRRQIANRWDKATEKWTVEAEQLKSILYSGFRIWSSDESAILESARKIKLSKWKIGFEWDGVTKKKTQFSSRFRVCRSLHSCTQMSGNWEKDLQSRFQDRKERLRGRRRTFVSCGKNNGNSKKIQRCTWWAKCLRFGIWKHQKLEEWWHIPEWREKWLGFQWKFCKPATMSSFYAHIIQNPGFS